MKRTGPPPTPTALKIIRNNPGRRPINGHEPQPPAAPSVAPPRWLQGEALALWTELAPALVKIGLLTVVDREALASGCRWWAIYRTADAALKRRLIDTTPSNGRQPRPELAIAQKAHEQALKILTRFGITPAERVRLTTATPGGGHGHTEPDDPFDAFKKRKRTPGRAPA